MGNVLFRRKRIVAEELEELQQLSNELDEQIQNSLEAKYTVKWFLSLFFLLVMGSAVATVLLTVQDQNQRAAYAAINFIAGIALIYCIQTLITAFYDWSIRRKRKAREEISRKKVAILEKVKETETFKVAQEILTKYDETGLTASPQPKVLQAPNSPATAREILGLKSADFGATGDSEKNRSNGQQSAVTGALRRTVFSHPPRPFFKQRSVTEKFVDYILGDSISNRYALICAHCCEHNGMAREEEFDYIAYRCWVCGELNPARKQRIRVNSVEIRPSEAKKLRELGTPLGSSSVPSTPTVRRKTIVEATDDDGKTVDKRDIDLRTEEEEK